MPEARDLTGLRFGALVAKVRVGGSWRCVCDCGELTNVPVGRLSCADGPKAIRACERCRSRSCVVCGELYLRAGSGKTCGSEFCRLEHRRAVNREAMAAAELRAPGLHGQRQREYLAKVRADPFAEEVRKAKLRDYARKRRERLGAKGREARYETVSRARRRAALADLMKAGRHLLKRKDDDEH